MFSNEVKIIVNYYKNKNKSGLRQSQLYYKIVKETYFLPKNCKTSQQCWHILNNTKEIPTCKECNNNVKWDKQINLYRNYCSTKCTTNSKEVKDKKKQTSLDRYGETSYSKTKEYKEKIKQTCLDRYGVENPSQSEEIKNKKKQTCLKHCGVENYNQRHLSQDTLDKLKDKEWLIDQHHNKEKTLKQIACELGLYGTSSINYRFHKYNINILTCPNSEKEIDLIDFIRSIYSKKILTNTRKIITPFELDIYLPQEKLAIEFNGLYWHSDKQKDKLYHFNKSKLCSDKDIRLIHIFEDEWINNKDEIKRWIKKYLFDNDYITKDLLIKDLNNQKKLNLSLNWPINYDKLERLGYVLDNRLESEEQLLSLDKTYHKIYDCGKVIYKRDIKLW